MRRRYGVTIFLAIVIIALGYFVFGRDTAPKFTTALAKKGTITQSVSVTGQTKPAEEVDLAFEKSGKVNRTLVMVGDHAKAGQTLVELETSELAAQLLEAQAQVDTQQAKLSDLRQGTRQEDIDIKRSELQKAQQDLASEYSGVLTELNGAYTESDDAVRKQIDDLFNKDDEISPELTFSVSNSQTETDAENQRFIAGQELKNWRNELDALAISGSQTSLTNGLNNAKTHLNAIYRFLSVVLDAVTKSANIDVTTLATYKANVNTALTNVNAALTSANDKAQDILAQTITVQKIENELKLKLAGSTPQEIVAQESQVRQAEAKVQLIRAQIGKNILRAPFAGIVTVQDAKVGEIVGANTRIVSIISENNFEIEANVPEADITKIKVGDTAELTLDAYGPEIVFSASVVKIDPAETIVEGVTTYKTTMQFETKDERIRPRMTANIEVLTAKKENVLVIPQRAIVTRDGEKFVRIAKGDTPEEVSVEVGLQGSDGMVEIISGVREGDNVVTSRME